jgi:signal transduction histidine kinase
MIAYKRPRRILVAIFHDSDLQFRKWAITLGVYTERCYWEIRKKKKEHLIRELTQNNKDLKQFSYITSHNLRAPLSNLTGLLNLIDDIPVETLNLKKY